MGILPKGRQARIFSKGALEGISPNGRQGKIRKPQRRLIASTMYASINESIYGASANSEFISSRDEVSSDCRLRNFRAVGSRVSFNTSGAPDAMMRP